MPETFAWPNTGIYYDLNYNTDNPAIRIAHEAGMITIDGSAMLVGQAIRSFYLWSGQEVAFDNVYSKVFGS